MLEEYSLILPGYIIDLDLLSKMEWAQLEQRLRAEIVQQTAALRNWTNTQEDNLWQHYKTISRHFIAMETLFLLNIILQT